MLRCFILITVSALSCGASPNSNKERPINSSEETTSISLIHQLKVTTEERSIVCGGINIEIPKSEKLDGDIFLLDLGLKNPQLANSRTMISDYINCIRPALEESLLKE